MTSSHRRPPPRAACPTSTGVGDEPGGEGVTRDTRRVYATARRQLAAWLDGRPLDDAVLAAYVRHLQQTGRAPATADQAVAAVKRAARDAGEEPMAGPLTRRALSDFRRAEAADAPARRGPAIGLTADECTAVLETCTRRRRTGRGLERPETAARRGLVDGAIVGLLFHGALRRNEVAALRWADVDLRAGEDVAVTLRRAQPDGGQDDDIRHLVGACAAAVRRLHAAVAPAPGDRVVGLRVHQINRRFAAACAAAGLEGRRTSHGGRVGLAAELAARGAPMRAIQLAGGWKSPSMVMRYATTVTTCGGAVRRFLG